VGLLIRSWNVFHGNAKPPRRRSYLREMLALACADEPDVVCLQELPRWALPRLHTWSGMVVAPAIARRGLRTTRFAGWATRLNNGLLRSALTGQANAILVSTAHTVEDLGVIQVSEHRLERRVCQAVRLDGRHVVANTHLSSSGHGQQGELARVLGFLDSVTREGEPVVLAGDLNVREPRLAGFTPGGPGIDHVLVRGWAAGALEAWPEDRRRQNGVVLSDHPPVELRLE
jgi:endonuclease/exonuclease/phosphatase family metal-dependent hydrolase